MAKRSIFITGAASGIGQATAERFAAAGWRVGLCDVNLGGIERLASRLGSAVTAHSADVCNAGALAQALTEFTGDSGLDVMFNCAGILEMQRFADCALDRMHKIIDVNVNGVINGIHHALPALQKGTDTRIITMSSVAAIHGIPDEAVYSASKFAVRALTEALNVELEASGIWVCDIMVAYVTTPMVLEAATKAQSVDILGVNVTARAVAETVWQAAHNRKVHWFVTSEDEAVAKQVDETAWESRRDMIKQITGYAQV